MTLKDLQPQIADALEGFLKELHHDDIKPAPVFTPFKQKKLFSNKKSKTLNLLLKLAKKLLLNYSAEFVKLKRELIMDTRCLNVIASPGQISTP